MNRWQQVEKLCQEALEMAENQRAAYLERACAGDEELRREVESLLGFDKPGDGFIEEPALEMAAKMIAHEKPESLAGRQLGSYQILSLLGTGGMGVVYKARDTRLNRSVAIKVLPANFMNDLERKRRFIQEARAASALNHPNIITIHDIGSEGGVDFIVMEYVAGKTLDQRIPRKGMRLDEALKLAIQMADALAKAHWAGIIHRDLKPANVMVTDDGLVKVLDFGLAKLTEVERPEGETRTLGSLTEEGMIVGTVSYMSPEQAEGKKLDVRSDIFSFGAVLYEMVTGRKAFEGNTNMSTLGAILKQEPRPLGQLVPGIPHDLEKIINRCLRKDPGRRFQDMEDLKVALDELKEESDSGKLAMTATTVSSTRRIWIWAGAILTLAVLAASGWFFRDADRKPAPSPQVIPLTSYPGWETSPSFSPDGNQVVFSWGGEKQDNRDIYVKLIGSPTPVRLTTDPAGDDSPAYSPDGRSIAFIRGSKPGYASFIIIPAIGGPERIVADLPEPAGSFSWFPDGKWVVTGGLKLLSLETGETRSLTSPPTKLSHDFSPAVSPDGRSIAFSRSSGLWLSEIYLLDLTDDLKPRGEPRLLTSLNGGSSGSTWTPNGREIIFSCDHQGMGALWKVPASGDSQPVKLSYISGEAHRPAISRGGNRLAYESWVRNSHIWRLPLSGAGVAGGPPAPFIASTRWESDAQYSPDGKRIAFESNRSGVHGIWINDSEGSNAIELFSRTGAGSGSPSWSPDGGKIAFDSNMEGNNDIYVIPANGGKPLRLTNNSADDIVPNWSRDGIWIYFASNRSGRYEVWKVPAGGGEAIQVTRNGGGYAFETPDGKSIYYIKGDSPSSLWKKPVSGGEETQVIPSVPQHALCLVNEGVYFFMKEPGADGKCSLQFLDSRTGRERMVARLSKWPFPGLSVSPDGRYLLFSQSDESGCDLMLVENFD